MDTSEIATIDSLLEYLGGCGAFQVLIDIFLKGAVMPAIWSMAFMAFGRYNPGWTCLDGLFNSSASFNESDGVFFHSTNNTNATTINNSNDTCYVFDSCRDIAYHSDDSTLVTEWNLACDRSWIPTMMISFQMGGVLVGALASGQLNLVLGRKATLYTSLALHAIFNLIARFSVNWEMFAALRFFIGISCGSTMLTSYVYPMEFITNRWRGIVAGLPYVVMGHITFSLAAMLIRDWRNIHLATAVLSTMLILPVFWTPDSIHWLAVKGKTKEAEKVGLKIAKVNKKPPPDMSVINAIAENERRIEQSKPQFALLDLYRHGLMRTTLSLALAWVTNNIVFYVMFYDVKSLSGNFYLNLLISSVILLASVPTIPLLTTSIGRKWSCCLLLTLASICCFILVCLHFVEKDGFDKGLASAILVFLIIMLVDMEWAILQLYNVELYPTVLRSSSYSHGSSLARVGGMLAPFLIPRDQNNVYISQIILLILMVSTCISLSLLSDTKGKDLEESLTLKTP